MTRPLALTIGEPAGIGPDITLTAWCERRRFGLPPFYVVADPDFVASRVALLGLRVPVATVEPEEAADAFPAALPVVPLGIDTGAAPGHPDDSSAATAVGSIRRAVADVIAGRAAAVVTNPIAKAVLYQAGFTQPGHTEYLADLTAEVSGHRPHPVMMLWAPELAVVPVTIHIPLRQVFTELTAPLVLETGRIVARDLRQRFGVARPRLAVAGLNPHAGEDGTLGEEDRAIVAPAVEALRREGFEVKGPLPADTLFHAAARAGYDAALCMYHDQALIPIKTLAFEHAVNVTLGLPFVRTSPDHGTAFDLAGTGRAHATSLIAAIRLAARLAKAGAPAPILSA